MSISRRHLFGVGAGAAGFAAVRPASAAGAVPRTGADAAAPVESLTASLDDPDPDLSYLAVSGLDFFPSKLSSDRIASGPGVYSESSATFFAPIPLPAGVLVREVSLFARLTTAGGVSTANPLVQVTIVDQGRFNIGWSGPDFTAPSSDIQSITAVIDRPISHGQQFYVGMSLPGGSENQIVGALVSYEPVPSGFVPIVPTRVYDSRFDMTPDQSGRLNANSERSFSIADGRDVDTGEITSADVIPEGATSIAYNLAIAQPAGTGFLSVNPSSATTFGAASINWGPEGEGALANAGLVQIDDDRRVRLFSGPSGDAHVVFDVTGYFV